MSSTTPKTLSGFHSAAGLYPDDSLTSGSAADLTGAKSQARARGDLAGFEIAGFDFLHVCTPETPATFDNASQRPYGAGAAELARGSERMSGPNPAAAGGLALLAEAPTLTLSVPTVVVNTAAAISGTIDAADAAAGTPIDVYSGTKLLGMATANASGVWSLAATVTAGSTASITASATNAIGEIATAPVTLHSFAFANSAIAAAAQTLASEIDAAAPSTVDVVTTSGAVTIPSSAAYVVDEATGANTITSATDPDMFVGTGGTTVTFTDATAPATQQQIVEADNSAAASLANLLGDGGAPAGSNEFGFEGVANVAFTGNANSGIEIAAGHAGHRLRGRM